MGKLLFIINIVIFLLFTNIIFANETQNNIKKDQENAVILARKGQYTKALPILENLAKRYPENPGIAADLIAVLSWSGNYKLAIIKFEDFISKDIKLPIYAYHTAAISYKRTGSFSKAEEVYKFILENNPKDGRIIRELVLCLLEKKEKDKILDLSSGQPAKDSLDEFIKEQLKKYPESRGFIKLTQADFLLERKYYQDSKNIYSELESDKRLEPDPQIGLCKIAISESDYVKAKKYLNKVYKKFPNQTEILFCKAAIEENDKDFIQAYNTYILILKKHPNHQAALNGKYRTLIAIGALSVAEKEIAQDRYKAYEYIKWMLKGDTIAYYVNSGDNVSFYANNRQSRKAVTIANEYILEAEKENKIYPSETLKDFIKRAKNDRIVALRDLTEMQQVIKEYNQMLEKNPDLPFWVLKAAGDAYLYLKQPEKALRLYQKVLEMKKEAGFNRPSDNFKEKMAIHYALLGSEKISEAGKLLQEIDNETPTYRIQRGLKLKNWDKLEVELAKGWFLIYDNKLGDALKLFKELNKKAPFNSNILTSLGYTKLYRGWPRNAQKDFSVSRTNSPNNTNTEIGYAITLNELDECREARQIASDLLKKHPKNLFVKRLNRELYLEEMPKFIAEGGFTNENSFENSGNLSLRLEYPIYPKRKIYTETKWLFLSDKDADKRRTITREYVGIDWRLNKDLTLIGSASISYNGDEPGFMGGLIYQPTDELTFQASYDTYSLRLPPKGLLNKLKGKEAVFITRYRHSEDFFIEAEVAYLRLSDNNNQMKYGINLKKTLTSNAYLKTKLGIRSSWITNSKDKDRSYYSPRYVAKVLAVPEVELLLYRNYDFEIVSRTLFGVGPQWEANFGADVVGFIREELDFKINDQLKFLIGATLFKDVYDGDNTYGWGMDGRLEYIIDYNQIADFFR